MPEYPGLLAELQHASVSDIAAAASAPVLSPSPFPPMPPSADSPLIPIFVSRPADLTYATATAPSNNQREHWISALEEEMASLRGHATWYIFDSEAAWHEGSSCSVGLYYQAGCHG